MKFFYFFAVVLVLAGVAGLFAWDNYISPGKMTQDITVVLPKGNGFSKSVDELAQKGVIDSPLVFKVIGYLDKDAGKIKAGEYFFPAGISPQAVMQMMVAGQVVVHKITVAEGLNVREVVALLKADTVLTGDVQAHIEEGSLLPQTYYYNYGDTRASIIARMQEKMKSTLTELWAKKADGLPYTTPAQAVTLASIVEKETGVAAERARIAAVFLNRIKIGMKLQSDPTTVYGLEQISGKPLGRSLTFADLKSETPYNTYVIDGIPPAPITNPSREAIEAVLHPATSTEIYFVATGSGGHNFASTLEQHNRNVQEYREKNRHN
jgi:UPF0755 protein